MNIHSDEEDERPEEPPPPPWSSPGKAMASSDEDDASVKNSRSRNPRVSTTIFSDDSDDSDSGARTSPKALHTLQGKAVAKGSDDANGNIDVDGDGNNCKGGFHAGSNDSAQPLANHDRSDATAPSAAETPRVGPRVSNMRRHSYISDDGSSNGSEVGATSPAPPNSTGSAGANNADALGFCDLQCCASSVREESSEDGSGEHVEQSLLGECKPGAGVDEASHAPAHRGSSGNLSFDRAPSDHHKKGAHKGDDAADFNSRNSSKPDSGGFDPHLGDYEAAILRAHLDEFESQQLQLQEKLQALQRERETCKNQTGKCRRTVEELEMALASERARREEDARRHEEELELQLREQDEKWQRELQRLQAEVRELRVAAEAELRCSEQNTVLPNEVVTAAAREMASSYVKQLGNCFAKALACSVKTNSMLTECSDITGPTPEKPARTPASENGLNSHGVKMQAPQINGDLAIVNLSFSPSGGELQRTRGTDDSRIHADLRSAFDESPMPTDSDNPLNLSGIGDLLASLPKGPNPEHSNGTGSKADNIPTDITNSPDSSFFLGGRNADAKDSPSPASLQAAQSRKVQESRRTCQDVEQDISPATLLPPPMPINASAQSDACWAQPGTPPRTGRATPPRSLSARFAWQASTAIHQQGEASRSSTPPASDAPGRLVAVHAGNPAPSAFEWRLPVLAQLPGAPQFGSPGLAGSIVHRMPGDAGAPASPRFHHGQKVQTSWMPGAQARLAWSPTALSSDTPGSVSSLLSMTGTASASACTPPRGRPRY